MQLKTYRDEDMVDEIKENWPLIAAEDHGATTTQVVPLWWLGAHVLNKL